MQALDLDRLETIAEGLALLFYVLMFVAFVMALAGSAGSGLLLLIVGSCAHIGQAALREFVDGERPRRSLRVVRPARASAPVRGPAPVRERSSVRSGG